MAAWLYAYGKNGLAEAGVSPGQYLDILNGVPLYEIKILESMQELQNPDFSIRKDYERNRKRLEAEYRAMSGDDYRAYLDSIKLPFIEVDKLVDHFITEGERRERESSERFQYAYAQFQQGLAKSKWEQSGEGIFINNLLYFDAFDGLRLSLFNGLIWITGSFSVFSNYNNFQREISARSRDYYHAYFKDIFSALKSDFILYAHEWSGLQDDDDEFNLAKLKEQSNWEITSSDSIHTMDTFYYEQL